MEKRILYFIWFFLLFFGANVLFKINIDIKLVQSVLIGLSVILIIPKCKIVFRNRPLILLMALVSLYSTYKLFTDTGEGTRQTVLQIVEPPFVYAAFYTVLIGGNSGNNLKQKMITLFFLFYLFETGMAIVERILGTTILGWNEIEYSIVSTGSTEFRSVALHGHPLYNALMVSISMAFILLSPLKIKYKLLLWSIGYVSILCFNTRGSIVGNALLFATYIIYELFIDKKARPSMKKQLVLFSSVVIVLGLFLFFNLGLGGRLAEMGLFDESSAQARIDVWNIFDVFPVEYFLWGISQDKMQYVLYRAAIFVTENYWIDFALRLGVLFMLVYIIIYYKVIKEISINYTLFHKLYLIGAFLLIASTNNSLSSNGLALLFFLILLEIFNPHIVYNNMNKKYLECK